MAFVKVDDKATDADLMRRVQADDVEAFERLYDRYAQLAFRVAWSVCADADRAEEAVQEAFLKIWRGRERFDLGAASVQAWSMSIVRHAAIDTGRRHSEGLRTALARLPEAEAEVIGLAFFGELSHVEVAEVLHLPPGTVKGRIRLGLQKLRGELDRGA